MSHAGLAILILYYFEHVILAIFGLHRLQLVRLRRRLKRAIDTPQLAVWPHLAVYNEPNYVERLIDAAARLEYPGVLEIQLLDDSSDDTTSIAARRIAEWAARGVTIAHVRRGTRDGFKAGALAHGMTLTTAE